MRKFWQNCEWNGFEEIVGNGLLRKYRVEKLCVVNSVAGVASTNGDLPNQDLSEEVMDFIENDNAGEEFTHIAEDDDDNDDDGATDGVDAEGKKASTELPQDSVQEPAANMSQSGKPSATTAKETVEALSDV